MHWLARVRELRDKETASLIYRSVIILLYRISTRTMIDIAIVHGNKERLVDRTCENIFYLLCQSVSGDKPNLL